MENENLNPYILVRDVPYLLVQSQQSRNHFPTFHKIHYKEEFGDDLKNSNKKLASYLPPQARCEQTKISNKSFYNFNSRI